MGIFKDSILKNTKHGGKRFMSKRQLKEALKHIVLDIALPIALKIAGQTLQDIGKNIEENGITGINPQAIKLECSPSIKLDLEKKDDNSKS